MFSVLKPHRWKLTLLLLAANLGLILHLACGAHTLVARMPVPERMVEVGETVQVEFKMAKTHLFDKTNEATLV